MLKLSLDTCRCTGTKCTIRDTCLRYSDKPVGGMRVPYSDNLCIVLVAPIGWINSKQHYIGEQDGV